MKPRRPSSPAHPIRAIWRAGCSRSSSTATRSAPSRPAAAWWTGRATCVSFRRARTELEAYVGYYEPYATSHAALDKDEDFQEGVRSAARALCEPAVATRSGKLIEAGAQLREPRPK